MNESLPIYVENDTVYVVDTHGKASSSRGRKGVRHNLCNVGCAYTDMMGTGNVSMGSLVDDGRLSCTIVDGHFQLGRT